MPVSHNVQFLYRLTDEFSEIISNLLLSSFTGINVAQMLVKI